MDFENLNNNEKENISNIKEEQLQQSQFLLTEVTKILQDTNGSISWRMLASRIQGGKHNLPLVSPQTIMRFVMGLDGSSYEKTKIHPNLTQVTKQKR
mmetsp:Transcript_2025/g.2292  ORF Transcript_2025/g.2292 Transcript_2025/m.2292 type:complete len:97 (+) Transcript_2025:3-293(+)